MSANLNYPLLSLRSDESDGSQFSRAKYVVLVLFALGGQALMSYDGGATTASQEALSNPPYAYSPFMMQVLCAMDKIGQTLCAPLWGPCLRNRAWVKILLFAGLLLKGVSCYLFGTMQNHYYMQGSKFGMGAFEALVGIWAVTWINSNGPDFETASRWQMFLGISAGIGNGFGTAAAGYSSSYPFAFELQAGLLAVVSVCVICVPTRLLQACAETETTPDATPDTVKKMFCKLVRNKLWFLTVLATCLSTLITTGVNQMWMPTTMNLWAFTQHQATNMLLAVSALGGAVGCIVGPKMITWYMGQEDIKSPRGISKCMRLFVKVTFGMSVAGSFCALLLIGKVCHVNYTDMPQEAWGSLLACVLFLLFTIFTLTFSMNCALCTIMNDVVETSSTTTAVGVSQALVNVVGYACGMLLPGAIAETMERHLASEVHSHEFTEHNVGKGSAFATAMACSLSITWVLHIIMRLAARAAQRREASAAQ